MDSAKARVSSSHRRSPSLPGSPHGFSGRAPYWSDQSSAHSQAGRTAPRAGNASAPADDGANRSSLDPSNRPSSMRGNRSNLPWIGTFNFEDKETDPPPLPSNAPQVNDNTAESSSGDDSDLEKKGSLHGQESSKDPNLVEFDSPSDPTNPQNWIFWKKCVYTLCYGSLTLTITFASSIFSTAAEVTAKIYHVSPEVMVLGVALFVVGFAWGPIAFGPLSELYGRRPPLYLGFFAFAIFQIAVAVSQNLYSIFICRFFGGFFGSAPLAIVGGALADMWNPVQRGYAMCVFSGATFVGPSLAPVIGSFIVESYLGWRWTEYITAILAFAVGAVAVFVVPETFAPRILHNKAQRIRYETKNWAIHSSQDEQKITMQTIVEKYLFRPFKMMLMEPILVLITIYISLIYGIIYLFFESFPIAFQMTRHYSPGVASLPFIALLVGVIIGGGIIAAFTATRYKRKFLETGHVQPEERLVPMLVGGIILPIGLFWFAWTSDPGINVWPQIISIIPTGAGIMCIFLQGLNYLIDVYLMHANSAIAANTFVRSWVGGGFPMFAMGMYHNLGVPWATSLLAFLCIALYPAPIVFYIYGERIRSWSRYSPTA